MHKTTDDLQLGKEAIDKITGFKGIITGHADYLTGCDQYMLQPKSKEGAEFIEGRWFDEGRLQVLARGIDKEDVKGKKNGCDYSAPIK